MKNNYCVYRHIRLDTGNPFYVGKGKDNRPFIKSKRNKYWKNISSKVGYEVEIIAYDLTEEEAFEKEIEFIKLYKSMGYCEANLTNGGEGTSGLIPWNKGIPMNIETKIKVSNSKKNPSEETRKKISEAGKGRKAWNSGKKLTEEHKLSLAKQGKVYSPEYKNKMAKNKGSDKQFHVYTLNDEYVGSWYGKKTCAKSLNIDRSNIGKCLKGIYKQTNGYKFSYKKLDS